MRALPDTTSPKEAGLFVNSAKKQMQEGRIALGYQIRSQRSIERVMMAKAFGYHLVYIDLEHSSMGIESAAQLCLACVSEEIASMVRVPSHSLDIATRLLDYGAQGILVPHVNTAAEARHVVRTLRYPPYGELSEYGGAITRWRPMSKAERMRIKNDVVMISVAIETAEAVENVEEIAAVEGIDIISVGSNDLAVDLGVKLSEDPPEIIDAYARVVAAARRNGKFVRLGGVYTEEFYAKARHWGTNMIVLHGDRIVEDDMRTRIHNYNAAFQD